MKKVKPTTGRFRTAHECRLLIHAFYKLMSESLTITEVEAAKRVSELNGVSYKYVLGVGTQSGCCSRVRAADAQQVESRSQSVGGTKEVTVALVKARGV